MADEYSSIILTGKLDWQEKTGTFRRNLSTPESILIQEKSSYPAEGILQYLLTYNYL